jgi:hypothetical protein
LTIEAFQAAEALVNKVEVNMPKLISSVGRNDLAYFANRLLDTIQMHGGVMREKELQAKTYKDFKMGEFPDTINHLVQTEQLLRGRLSDVVYVGYEPHWSKFKTELEKKAKAAQVPVSGSTSVPPPPSPEASS